MKVYILVDKNNIVRCMATEECNLHKDKLHMRKFHVEKQGTCGDVYMEETDSWTIVPDNHVRPTQEEIYIKKISEEVREIAINSLIAKGELPQDYKE